MGYFPRVMGSASSTMRGDALAFLAASLTLKTPGLNCTLSMVSLIIGFDSSPILSQRADALKVHMV